MVSSCRLSQIAVPVFPSVALADEAFRRVGCVLVHAQGATAAGDSE